MDLFDTPQYRGQTENFAPQSIEPVPSTLRDLPEGFNELNAELGDLNALPETPVPSRPRLTAQDVSDMLAGRRKFVETNPDVTLQPGMRDELDRMGVEYNRTQRELKKLLGMPDADAAEVGRMRQGARELGSRLRRTAKDAATPPALPEPEPFTPPDLSTLSDEELGIGRHFPGDTVKDLGIAKDAPIDLEQALMEAQ